MDTAVYAWRAPSAGESVAGVLDGPAQGWCGLGADGGRAWWVVEVAPVAGVYRCSVGELASPPLTVGGDRRPSATVRGSYRCGRVEERINPPEPVEGGEAFLRYRPLPCATSWPGRSLPWDWP